MYNDPKNLKEALEPEPPILRTIDGTKYNWQKIYGGRKEIQEYNNQRTKVEDILVDWDEIRAGYKSKKIRYNGPLGYNDTYTDGHGYLYTDNSILACCTIDAWQGTFAPERQVEINFYVLTPIITKGPKTKKKKSEANKVECSVITIPEVKLSEDLLNEVVVEMKINMSMKTLEEWTACDLFVLSILRAIKDAGKAPQLKL